MRGIVTYYHGANVAAFSILLCENYEDKYNFFTYTGTKFKIYMWYVTVHLVKNIGNNLFTRKIFMLSAFNCNLNGISVVTKAGYITWDDLHKIYDIDLAMDRNLRNT